MLLAPILAQALSVSAGDRTEIRVRNERSDQYFDAATQGRLELRLKSSRVQWTLGYLPQYAVLAFTDKTQRSSLLQHMGTLNVQLQLTRRTQVFAGEAVSYGEQNYRVFAPASGPFVGAAGSTTSGNDAAQPTPVVAAPTLTGGLVARTLKIGTVMSSAGVAHRLSSTLQSSGQVMVSRSKGLDRVSRAAIPHADTMLASGQINHSIAPTLRFNLQAAVNLTQTKTQSATRSSETIKRQALWETLVGELQRNFSRTVMGSVSAGIAFSRSTGDDIPNRNVWVPTGAVGIRAQDHWQGATVSAGWLGRVAPDVDRITGTAVTRTQSAVDLVWQKRKLSVGVTGYWVTTLEKQTTVGAMSSSYGTQEVVGYQANRQWRFEVGTRQYWTSFVGGMQLPPQLGAFLAVTYNTGFLPL